MSHDRALASDLVTLKAIDIEVKLNASTTNTLKRPLWTPPSATRSSGNSIGHVTWVDVFYNTLHDVQ